MKFVWIILFVSIASIFVEGKRKRKFEGDFEFADEVDSKSGQKSVSERKKWIHDPKSELCKPLNCKKKEMCLLDETFAAYCVSKKDIHKSGDIIVPKSKATVAPPKNTSADDDEDDDADDEEDDDIFYDSEDSQDDDDASDTAVRCKACPIVKPVFLCGSDNRTYSSLCRLDYHNCLHRSHVKVSCKGFCPCKVEAELMYQKKQKQAERMNNLMTKFRNTMEREKANNYKVEKQSENKYDNQENKAYKAVKYDKYNGMKMDKKKYQDKYSYVPEDFKYDNKHYKYIKYKKYNKDVYNKNGEDKSHNEVIETKPNRPSKECSPAALQTMGNRLLDWFSVVMSESKKRKQHKIKSEVPSWCKSEVRWMFGYLDTDGDEKLSLQELYHMEHDYAEKCVKPFVDSCDSDRDIFISPKEWCHCFDKADRPCEANKKIFSNSWKGSLVYVPDCDSEGYFRPTQCYANTNHCWCVDKHGVETSNSGFTGRPNCDALNDKTKSKDLGKKDGTNEKVNIDDEDEDDDGNDSDFEGSADQPLDF